MKRFMMSDIHGFYEAFETALNKVDFSGENQLFLLGDYIDYGPDSRKVLEKIKALQEIYGSQKVITLLGNHEKALLDWLEEYADINRHICGVEQYRDAEWLLSDADGDYGTLRSFLSARHFWEFTEKKHGFPGIPKMQRPFGCSWRMRGNCLPGCGIFHTITRQSARFWFMRELRSGQARTGCA